MWECSLKCPCLCTVYITDVSLDSFYTFYQKLICQFTRDHIRFQLAQTPKNFFCEVQIHIDSLNDFQEIKYLLQQENIKTQLFLANRSADVTFHPSLLSSFNEDFFYTHPEKYLTKLINIWMSFNTYFESPYTPVFKLHLGKAPIKIEQSFENVLGITIGIKEQASLKEKIFKNIQVLIPSAALLLDTSIRYESSNGIYTLIYFEMRKIRGGSFTFRELQQLRKELPSMLHNRRMASNESTYFPMDEEGISHEVIRLARELRSKNDIPQVVINFQGVKQFRIRFSVILIYIDTGKNLLESQLENNLPNILHYIPKHKLELGYLFKRHLKRGLIFDLEIDNDFFSNEDGTLNLIGARGYIIKTLQEKIGDFRDCNGGLLLKQSQQLETLKVSMALLGLGSHALLEDFFYHLNPSSLQATIPIELMMKLYFLLHQVSKKNDPKSSFIYELKEELPWKLLVIKTREKNILNFLHAQIASNRALDRLVGSSEVVTENSVCICFFEMILHEKNAPSLISNILLALADRQEFLTMRIKKIFRINFHFGIPLSLNPQIIGDLRSYLVYKVLFEGLTRINPTGEVELAAAHAVETSSCGKEYTFYLRSIDWSNGEKLTAYHFILAWKKALAPQSSCSRTDIFYPILNAEKIRTGELAPSELGVYAKDANILVIRLERPCQYLLELLSHPICSPLYGDYPEPHIFNGPFIASSVKNAKKLRLIRNPFYWDAKNVDIDEIEISTHKETARVLKLFENNQLDYIGDPFSPLKLNIEEVQETPTWRPFYVYCNTASFPLNCREVRKALCASIDRQYMMNALHLKSPPLKSPLPQPLSLQTPALDLFDPLHARSLFERALRQLNLSRSHFPEITLMMGNADYFRKIAEILKQQWQEILGINIHVIFLEWDQSYALFEQGRYQLGGMFQTAYFTDPFFYLKMFDDTSRLTNFSGWKNQEYHACIEKSEAAVDADKRLRFLHKAEEILLQEMPIIPLFTQTYHYQLSEKVKNLNISKYGYLDLKQVQME